MKNELVEVKKLETKEVQVKERMSLKAYLKNFTTEERGDFNLKSIIITVGFIVVVGAVALSLKADNKIITDFIGDILGTFSDAIETMANGSSTP